MGNSTSAEKLYYSAREYNKKGDLQKAEEYYIKAANLGYINAYNELAILLHSRGRNIEVVKYLRTAVSIQCYPVPAEWARCCYNLGYILEVVYKKLKEATIWYQKAALHFNLKAENRLKEIREVETTINFAIDQSKQLVADKIWEDIRDEPKSDIIKNPQIEQTIDILDGLCVICICNPATHAAVPCGHYNYCLNCINIDSKNMLKCAICRGPVNNYCKIYK
jgi:TPR repeat protein